MGWQSDEQAFAFNWDDGFPGEDCLREEGLKLFGDKMLAFRTELEVISEH
jgi:hypothetical protein